MPNFALPKQLQEYIENMTDTIFLRRRIRQLLGDHEELFFVIYDRQFCCRWRMEIPLIALSEYGSVLGARCSIVRGIIYLTK